MTAFLVSFVAGLAGWTLLEYAIHSWLGHLPRGRILISSEHLKHHSDILYFTPLRLRIRRRSRARSATARRLEHVRSSRRRRIRRRRGARLVDVRAPAPVHPRQWSPRCVQSLGGTSSPVPSLHPSELQPRRHQSDLGRGLSYLHPRAPRACSEAVPRLRALARFGIRHDGRVPGVSRGLRARVGRTRSSRLTEPPERAS